MTVGNMRKPGNWALSGLLMLLALGGCTRRYYRNQTDKEVGQILAEKDRYGFWRIANYHVYPDSRSRFADPTNPDRPPMPPDDPASRDTAPNPQRPHRIQWIEGEGYLELLRIWDSENRTKQEEDQRLRGEIKQAAHWEDSIPSLKAKKTRDSKGVEQASLQGGPEKLPTPTPTQPGVVDGIPGRPEHPFLITLEQCSEMALINSRELQTNRENLYLASLPVTQQRYTFAAQYAATAQAVRQYSGRQSPLGQSNTWNISPPAGGQLGSNNTTTNANGITSPGGLGMTKLFSTGAQLLLQFANQTIIDLGGNLAKPVTSVTTFNLDIMQPLLQGGGKAVTLEPLTQAERNLMYQIRTYCHFRKVFYVGMATGGDFSPFNVQPIRGGFLPTLFRQARLIIEKDNYRNSTKIENFIKYYEEGGQAKPLQVAQAHNAVLTSEGNLYQREQDVNDGYDNLKIQLGLPLNINLVLDDTLIKPIERHLKTYEILQDNFKATVQKATEYDPKDDPDKLRDKLRNLAVNSDFVKGTDLRKHLPGSKGINFPTEFTARWKEWEKLPPGKALENKLEELIKTRRKIHSSAAQDLTEEQKKQLQELDRKIEMGHLEQYLREYEAKPWTKLDPAIAKEKDPLKKAELEIQRRKLRVTLFQNATYTFSIVFNDALSAWVEEWYAAYPPLPPIVLEGVDFLAGDEAAYAVATRIALENRLDLMNQRAAVVDAWRQIAVSANALLGVANVEYHLTGVSPLGESKPLAFDGSRMQHQLVLTGQLPLVRRLERNNYRAALINYQQQRRALMLLEDTVVGVVRNQIRTLRDLAENYRIQKMQTELAYRLLDSSYEALAAPPGGSSPGELKADTVPPPSVSSDASAAALVNQLLQNQANLVNQQTQVYQFWINYLSTRMQLFRDMEIMQLDNRGVWIDEYATRESPQSPLHRDGVQLAPQQPAVEQPALVNQPPRLLPPAAVLPGPSEN